MQSIKYRGINVTTEDYLRSKIIASEFKEYLCKFYKISEDEVGWDTVSNYLDYLVSQNLLYIHNVIRNPKFSGLTEFDEDHYVMVLNENEEIPITRRRFTKTHELAHVIAHFNCYGLGVKISLPLPTANNVDLGENEADFIANELLMPDSVIYSLAEKDYDFVQMRNYFQVSSSAMQTRLNNYLIFQQNIPRKYSLELTNGFRYRNDNSLTHLIYNRKTFVTFFLEFQDTGLPETYQDFCYQTEYLFASYKFNSAAKRILFNDIQKQVSLTA